MLPLDEARKFIQNEDNASAIKILTKLVRENPRDIDAWLMLASAASDNEYRQKCLEYVLSFEPDNPVALTELQKLQLANQSSIEYPSDLIEQRINQDDDVKPLASAIQVESSTENIENREFDQAVNLVDEEPIPAQEQENSQSKVEAVLKHDQEEIEQPIHGPWDSKKLNRWDQPFRNEKDVIDHFENIVNSIIQVCKTRKFSLNKEINSMNYALKCFKEYKNGQARNTNYFLAPAFKAALPIAEEFFQKKDNQISAWITNIFSEIGKILIDRDRIRQEYFPIFQSYLQLYCNLIEVSFETRPDNTEDEIDGLGRRLRSTIGFALGTAFKRDLFQRDFQPDQELVDSLVNETLARHFKWRLQDLLDNNRPRVWPFVVNNMPKIYKLRLGKRWDEYLGEDGKWEVMLGRYGFGDSLRSERNLFIIPSRVGRIHPDRLNQIRDAAAQDDFSRVRDLLKINSDEIRSFLQMRAREHLDYREPNAPHFGTRDEKDMFDRAQTQIKRGGFSEALTIMKDLWQRDPSNNGMREWIAYLQLKTGNIPAAENLLDRLQKNAVKKDISFSTDWNMAVLHNERHDDAGAYKILQQWLNQAGGDDAFLEVMLHLALKNNDNSQFLSIIPRTRHLRFHTLAFSIAYELRDEAKQREFLGQIYQDLWELPPVNVRFNKPEELKSVVNRAIVENQTEQLISWLGERIKQVQSYAPNYLELARVYEDEKLDIDSAFRILDDRLKQEVQKKPRNQARMEDACRDLLDLCKRHRRQDFGEKAFKRAEVAGASEDLLNAYVSFKASDPGQTFRSLLDQLYQVQRSTPKNQGQINKLGRELLTFAKEQKNHDWGIQAFGSVEQSGASEQILREFEEFAPFGWKVKEETPQIVENSIPDLWNKIPANQIISVTTDLRRIRSVSLFVQNRKVIGDLLEIITLLRPDDSSTVVELIQGFSSVLDSFVNIPKDQKDQRRVLFERALNYQKRLNDLLNGTVLNPDMAKMLQSFEEGTVRPVMGDLTRQVGIGPDIDAEIENPFISLEASRSTLVLRLKNISTQPVTSVFTQLMTEGDLIWLDDRGERLIDLLEPGSSRLITFPYELKQLDQKSRDASEVIIRISIRASAEGYPNQDLADVRRAIPIKTMQQAIGRSSIRSLFKASNPLDPEDAELFQGRQDVMEKIQESFYEGKQSERFFLDGIRRVGKTSLLNFLPKYLPESLIPIKVNFESLGIIKTGFSSAGFLYTLCEKILQTLPEPEGMPILPLDEARFIGKPALAFQEFFRSVKRSYPNKVVFLMIDEFQVLLDVLATSATDSLALDLMRSSIDERLFYVLFTGSTRYDRLSSIYDHRIIGSLSRLRVSFLTREDVGRVIRAGMEKWVKVPDETIQAIYELSGGYPRLVHIYGSELVSLQNRERRTIVTPEDVERVTREEILNNDELFSHLWNDQLGIDEEQFTETLLRHLKNRPSMSKNEYFESIAARNQQSYQRALEDLRASEVLDSSQPDILRFSGLVMRRWIEIHVDSNGQLHIQRQREDRVTETRGSVGIFVDHENLVKALERISNSRGVVISDRLNWFQAILANIMREAENRFGHLDYRVAVAFWSRSNEASLTPAYALYNYITPQPTEMKSNAADFKLTTEVETAYQTSIEKNNRMKQAIVVTGDGDFAQTVLKLKNEGVQVQVWGGGKETKDKYFELVGPENVIALDNVCGL